MRFPKLGQSYGFLILAVLLSGCLPSSCNRVESRVLMPSDSLSRAFAETMPIDTLEVLGVIGSSDSLELQYLRTIAYGDEGRLWLSDTQANVILELSEDGELLTRIDAKDFTFPYIAGFRSDTLVVFSPGTARIVMIHEGEEVHSIAIPGDRPEAGVLEYVAAQQKDLYYKVVGEDFDGYIARLDDEGSVLDRVALPRHYWQHAGLLRFWGNRLVSLAGFRTQFDVISEGARLDTLTLFGFDSPMLPRRRQYLLGSTDQPPLLTASAASDGELMFVLNMRPGWLRVDVYGADGRLKHILIQPAPEFNQNYYPSDIAVRRVETGEYELAIAVVEPVARVERYRWRQR